LARQFRQREAGQQIPLIALTGYGQANDLAQAFEAGFDKHLTKPIEPQQLSEIPGSQQRQLKPR